MTDKAEIVNIFNEFCTNIDNNLANEIKWKAIRGYTYYVNNIINSNFTIKYIEEDIMKSTMINLPYKGSCGYNGLSTKLLKLLEPILTKSLILLTNQVVTT